MDKVLIGIHGKPRAGKDTLANYLVVKHNMLRYGPGDSVKRATAAMFDVDIENFYDGQLKESFNDFWQMTHREMLQKVGKESSRDVFGEDFWMRHTEKVWSKIQQGLPRAASHGEPYFNGMVLADIRYANETTWIKQRGGLMIFVTREVRGFVANEQHVAEQGLSLDLADVVIPNNGTIEELHERLDLVVAPLFGGK